MSISRVFFNTFFGALTAVTGLSTVVVASAQTVPTSTTEETPIYRGATAVGPFYPKRVEVDLRKLPTVRTWREGDPVKARVKRMRPKDPEWKHPAPVKRRDPLMDQQLQYTSESTAERTLSTPSLNFSGQPYNGVFPPDTVGEVGKNYYVQMINDGDGSAMTFYSKADGSLVAGPIAMQGMGTGDCATGLGDPVVLYDEAAERWLFTEFSNSGDKMCVYVSMTDDPITGGFWAYTIQGLEFPDYPKYGVWSDAYYIGSNEATSRLYALDRTAMLSGGAASMQRISAPDLPGFGFQVLVPADIDGTTQPPAGTPNYFVRHRDDEWHGGVVDPNQDFIELWEFHVDFSVPSNSFVLGPVDVGVSDFDSELCDAAIFACFTQPSGPPLDPLREVVMFRVSYRNFGTHEMMLVNWVVDLDGTNHGGIRWAELRRTSPGAPWVTHQEGTWTQPLPDLDHRWMGASAMDSQGNIALGYSVSGSATFPSMRYTGRLATDPLGVMTQPELSIVEGDFSSALNRWGDYAAMSVDPIDGCTFWHTNMYGTAPSWGTQIAAFAFSECLDRDADGVENLADNCPDMANADQLDSDGDMVGNACDNCTEVANPTQCDTNSDGYGNHCDGDINDNNVINFVDLGLLKSSFGVLPSDAEYNPHADLNCNDVVNFVDLGILKSKFLGEPGPSALAP